jgi:hypothetical protein
VGSHVTNVVPTDSAGLAGKMLMASEERGWDDVRRRRIERRERRGRGPTGPGDEPTR